MDSRLANATQEGWLSIERVPSDLESLRPWVTDDEWVEAATFRSSERRAEWLGWRALIRRRLGADTPISYNEKGAPLVGAGYISVSHSAGWIAVLWSPFPCAVDIELSSRPLPPAAAERYGISSLQDWCSHEARVKFASLSSSPPPVPRIVPHSDLVVAAIYI